MHKMSSRGITRLSLRLRFREEPSHRIRPFLKSIRYRQSLCLRAYPQLEAHPSSKTLPAFCLPCPCQDLQEPESGILHPTQDVGLPWAPVWFVESGQKGPLAHMGPACRKKAGANDEP